MDIAELKQKSVAELHELAQQLNISNYSGLRKQDLIFRIEQALLETDTVIRGEGVLEILPEGYGFLRSQDWNYLYGPDDIYVSPSQIKRFDLRTGDTVKGQVRPPKEGERHTFCVTGGDEENVTGYWMAAAKEETQEDYDAGLKKSMREASEIPM